jgi:non-ribosomal peptide synthetase component F
LGLPLDRARPVVQAHRGAGFGFGFEERVVGGLGVVGRSGGATLFMVLLAVWVAVLGRWCDQDDVVVGAPIAGRSRAELEGLIGFFVNTLVLRVDVGGDPSFGELVGRVREVALGAYAHADVPFEKLVEELAPQRDLSRNPLFQVTFQLFESPSSPDAIAARSQLEVPVTSSLFDIRLDVFPSGGGLAGRVEYDTELFEESSIRWLIDRFVWIAGQVAADPQRRLSELDWIPPSHKELLASFNATGAAIPRGTVPELVAARAARSPEAVAVSDAEGAWSYRELLGRADAIAAWLGGAGVGRGDVVAVYVARGRGFVAGALGAMRAGGAYLPLDAAYPPARVAHILADGRPRALLSTRALVERLEVPPGTRVLCLDEWPAGASAPEVAIAPGDVAYVIYTSGSTGTPKGVAIGHESLINLVAWHQHAYRVTPADRGSQISSVGFDAAVWELWPYLTAGASVHVCDDEVRGDTTALLSWLTERQITVTFIPTPLAELLLDCPWPQASPLRYLLTGGDVLRRWANPQHPYTLVNHYGPTEATVVATATPIATRPPPHTQTTPDRQADHQHHHPHPRPPRHPPRPRPPRRTTPRR